MDNLNKGTTTQALNGNPGNEDAGNVWLTEREIRYKQQMQWSQSEASRFATEKTQAEERANKYKKQALTSDYKKVYRNGTFNVEEFKEIQIEDPDYAEELAGMFEINGKPATAENILASFWSAPSVQQKTIDPDEMRRQITEEVLSWIKWAQIKASVSSRFQSLPENVRAKAEENYNLITNGRNVSESEAVMFVQMASQYAMSQVPGSYDKNIANMGSMVSGGIAFNGNIETVDPNKISDDDYKDAIAEMFSMNRWSAIGNTLASIHKQL